MTISSTEMQKQRYSHQLAKYTRRQWIRACGDAGQSYEPQGLPTSPRETSSRQNSAGRESRKTRYADAADQREKTPPHRELQV
ncbi:hypothetical protein PILCRDRAFT_826840 [Piloderma croceum F 1598]|uniref:Uncharacterized protein n=1 Tax=Piloderma croceum (strain F 1598) TaxID=765440 RepID=A0A0C3F7T1_PILCF|nr:hypothetical protein PILCRDRAFT_826840 [Piloderma croceum F 1598]